MKVRSVERDRRASGSVSQEFAEVYRLLESHGIKCDPEGTDIGSSIFAMMPGDGSAREQAASCQRVLGASANFAKQYATKRYRSNCINWGMVPFIIEDPSILQLNDYVFVPGIRQAIIDNTDKIEAYRVRKSSEDDKSFEIREFEVSTGALTADERQIIIDGCLINYYKH